MIMNLITKLGLQLFADAGTMVNATGNYVNASTGTATAFDATHTLAPELKTFYDTELLENARAEMFYAQFGKKQALPKNHGGTVEWRKWNTFDKAGKLTEGVIPTGQKFGVTKLEGSINQYGTYTSITDRLELRAYDDVILGATEEMGASAAETQEKLIRDALLTNTNVLYCDNISAAGAYISTPTSCAEMGAGGGTSAADGYAYLTPDMIEHAEHMAAVLGLDATFRIMDAENPDFEAESFDVLVTRNLTWTLPHVEKAYREWYRILKPGGVLINFDADYSAALEDEQQGRKKHELPENHAHKLVPDDLMAENNAITMEIGAYHGPRPQWDVQLLIEAGFERVTVDKGVYKRIYAEIDEFINPTPIFTIAAFK